MTLDQARLELEALVRRHEHRMTAVERCAAAAALSTINREMVAAGVDDLNVQCKFWRQAAEHAVKGWNALEDRVSAGLDALDAIEGNVDAVRELLGGAEERAPPDIVKAVDDALAPQQPSEPGTMEFRVVEDESPLPWCRNKSNCTSHAGCSCLSMLKKG